MRSIAALAVFAIALPLSQALGVVVFQDDFSSFNAAVWGDTFNVPLSIGRPQLLQTGTDAGRSVLFMQSTMNDGQVRGIGTQGVFSTLFPLTVDVTFKPQSGGIDGALQLWLNGNTANRNLVVNVFGGNFGTDRFVASDYNLGPGQYIGSTSNFRASASSIWDYDNYYRYTVQVDSSSTRIDFKGNAGQLLWSNTYAVGLSYFGSDLHLNLSQFMYIPGRTSDARVAVDQIQVSQAIPQTVPEPTSALIAVGFACMGFGLRRTIKTEASQD